MDGLFDQVIGWADKIGSLSAAAILALVCIAQGYIIYRKETFTQESNEKWRQTREGQIRAEEGQTQVVAKQTEVLVMNTSAVNALASRVDRLGTLIDERIPKGGNHV